jgi:hypothetical protein
VAQIFVSHGAKHSGLTALLSRAFAAKSVRGIFEKFDAILKGRANAARIAEDVRQSNAVYINSWRKRRTPEAYPGLNGLRTTPECARNPASEPSRSACAAICTLPLATGRLSRCVGMRLFSGRYWSLRGPKR